MKILFMLFLVSSGAISEARDTYVKGYVKKDGTYVAPYYRTEANNTKNDNYSTKGNVNPYTGKEGTKEPDPYYAPANDSSDE